MSQRAIKDKIFKEGHEAAIYYSPVFEQLPVSQLAFMASTLYCYLYGREREDGKFVIQERDVQPV